MTIAEMCAILKELRIEFKVCYVESSAFPGGDLLIDGRILFNSRDYKFYTIEYETTNRSVTPLQKECVVQDLQSVLVLYQ